MTNNILRVEDMLLYKYINLAGSVSLHTQDIVPGLPWIKAAGASTVSGNIWASKNPDYNWYYALQRTYK